MTAASFLDVLVLGYAPRNLLLQGGSDFEHCPALLFVRHLGLIRRIGAAADAIHEKTSPRALTAGLLAFAPGLSRIGHEAADATGQPQAEFIDIFASFEIIVHN
jgi:hypothetical protein